MCTRDDLRERAARVFTIAALALAVGCGGAAPSEPRQTPRDMTPAAGSRAPDPPAAGSRAPNQPAAGSRAPELPAAGSGDVAAPVPFDAGNAPDRNRVAPGGVCARLAAISCAAQAHCCTGNTRSVETCRSALTASCRDEAFLDAASQNTVTGFDTGAAERAFAELERKASQCSLEIGSWSLGNDGLRTVFQGTVAPGASCKPLLVTDKAQAAAALLACTDSATTSCLPESILGAWTCAPKNDVGGDCVTDYNCRDGQFCNNPNMAPLGRCAQRRATAEACDNGTQCQTLACSGGACVVPDQQVAYCEM